MNASRVIRFLLVIIPLLAACSPAATAVPTTYTTVSEATLKSGEVIPAPKGEVVLTVDGMISQTNVSDALQFDLPTLESLGVVQYDVDDPFAKKKVVYDGVLLSQVLKAAGADANATTLTL